MKDHQQTMTEFTDTQIPLLPKKARGKRKLSKCNSPKRNRINKTQVTKSSPKGQ